MRVVSVYDTVAEVMHTLPKGERVFGIAAFKNDIYVLRWKGREHVEVYDATTFALQRCLDVPNLRGYTNMALCPRHLCLYIGDNIGGCVHRVELKGTFTQWPVGGIYIPACLSVNAKSNVLVTCKASGQSAVYIYRPACRSTLRATCWSRARPVVSRRYIYTGLSVGQR